MGGKRNGSGCRRSSRHRGTGCRWRGLAQLAQDQAGDGRITGQLEPDSEYELNVADEDMVN
jgi:hypothetical protein